MTIGSNEVDQIPSVSQINNEKFQAELKKQPTVLEIQEWLVSYLVTLLEIAPNLLDVKKPFDRYGLDSSAAVGLTGELEQWLGYEIEPTLLFDYPTIEAVAQHLANQ